MALINRLSRLFQADFHALLDRIEEPEQLLHQAVREMEALLADEDQRLRLLQHERQQVSRIGDELSSALEEIDEQLDVCFQSQEEALAKKLIRRQLETQHKHQRVTRKGEAMDLDIATLSSRVEEHGISLESMRQKAELLATKDSAGSPPQDPFDTPHAVGDEDVEVAFLREQQQRAAS